MGNGRENVCAVSGRALDAVAVIDSALARFMVDVEVLEVVVKVDGAGAEVAAEEGGVGGEDGGDVDVSLAAEGDGEAGLPFVEVGDNGAVELARDVLWSGRVRGCKRSIKTRRGSARVCGDSGRRMGGKRLGQATQREKGVPRAGPRGVMKDEAG